MYTYHIIVRSKHYIFNHLLVFYTFPQEITPCPGQRLRSGLERQPDIASCWGGKRRLTQLLDHLRDRQDILRGRRQGYQEVLQYRCRMSRTDTEIGPG